MLKGLLLSLGKMFIDSWLVPLIKNLLGYYFYKQAQKESEKKNREVNEQVEQAETIEERREAADAIRRGYNKKS